MRSNRLYASTFHPSLFRFVLSFEVDQPSGFDFSVVPSDRAGAVTPTIQKKVLVVTPVLGRPRVPRVYRVHVRWWLLPLPLCSLRFFCRYCDSHLVSFGVFFFAFRPGRFSSSLSVVSLVMPCAHEPVYHVSVLFCFDLLVTLVVRGWFCVPSTIIR